MRRSLAVMTALCASLVHAQPLDIRVEPALAPWPADDVITTVMAAASTLYGATGREIRLVGSGGCPLSFYRSTAPAKVDAMAYREPCRIEIRIGPGGAQSLDRLRCIAMHEMGHLLLPFPFHSADPDSFIYDSVRQDSPCLVTQDFVDEMWGD